MYAIILYTLYVFYNFTRHNVQLFGNANFKYNLILRSFFVYDFYNVHKLFAKQNDRNWHDIIIRNPFANSLNIRSNISSQKNMTLFMYTCDSVATELYIDVVVTIDSCCGKKIKTCIVHICSASIIIIIRLQQYGYNSH